MKSVTLVIEAEIDGRRFRTRAKITGEEFTYFAGNEHTIFDAVVKDLSKEIKHKLKEHGYLE